MTNPRPIHKRIRFWLGVTAVALNVGLVATGAITLREGATRSAEEIGWLLATTMGAGYSIAHARSSANQDKAQYVSEQKLNWMILQTDQALKALRREYERRGTTDMGGAEGRQGGDRGRGGSVPVEGQGGQG